jgi:hypothetical protein
VTAVDVHKTAIKVDLNGRADIVLKDATIGVKFCGRDGANGANGSDDDFGGGGKN